MASVIVNGSFLKPQSSSSHHRSFKQSIQQWRREWSAGGCRYGASQALVRSLARNEMLLLMETGFACRRAVRIFSKASETAAGEASKIPKPNLNEYMVTLEKPIGIRFAQTLDGLVFVHALAKKGNAENSRMIMVGDILKKSSGEVGDTLLDVQDLSHTMNAIKSCSGPISFILERPTRPVSLESLHIDINKEILYNPGRVAVATWNNKNLAFPINPSSRCTNGGGQSVGFAVYTSKYLSLNGVKKIANFSNNGLGNLSAGQGTVESSFNNRSKYTVEGKWEMTELPLEIIATYNDQQPGVEVEWTHGDFPLQEYSSAMSRTANDLCYNHKLGMAFTKITEHVYVGSCLQEEADLDKLQRRGIGAVLNLQTPSEQVNWEIDGKAIDTAAKEKGVLMTSCPIRDVDTVDLRRKLPFAVGILYRLLRKGYRVYVTCTTGLDRAPACVIAYLHWLQDVAFEEAVDFVRNMHPCGPDRPALVWATWDLIAMAENGNHKGPPTHAVQFVWNHGSKEGEDVMLVGDFNGGWDEPIRATHVSPQKCVVDLRLPQGKYHYKFIVGGQWKHSTSLPTEVDKWGNMNNVIKIGIKASTKCDTPVRHPTKELTSIRIIERPLTEDERFTLAFAARRIAFGICPIRLTSKL